MRTDNVKVLLNEYDDPRRSEEIWVGKGDTVIATFGATEYGFIEEKKYEILGIENCEYLVLKNEEGKIDYYSTDYFTKYNFI